MRRLLLACPVLFALSCAPIPTSQQGDEVFGLYNFFSLVAAVIFAIVAGLLGWSIIRYRRRDDELPPQFHTNVPLEIVWFAIPQLIVVVLFVMTVTTSGVVNEEVADPALRIEVQGFQWGWRFVYDNGAEVIGRPEERAEIVVPARQPIEFVLLSQDVVHSFYVPRFLVKRDMLPDGDNRLDVTIEEEGSYSGFCAEFCGLLHDRMTFTIQAVDADEFDEWVARAGTDGNG